jgi:hypothetical protein
MKKALLRDASIPLAFILGIIAFFALVPWESITLNDFIAYMASLSTGVGLYRHYFATVECNERPTERNADYQKLTESAFASTRVYRDQDYSA